MRKITIKLPKFTGFGFTPLQPCVWFYMKQFLANNWGLLKAVKDDGATCAEIYKTLARHGFPGTYDTFYTYWLEVSKMTPAQRKRCAKS